MKTTYINSDFHDEYMNLASVPSTAREAYNKLVCLSALDRCMNPNYEREQFVGRSGNTYSKRRARITRMFYALQPKV